ncbi:MAG: hypothetical protein HYV63_19590 [Candidatus Schekmanbacteria bacterium]|nr:hypothetical protein [Candidatus Schekmanbacteria bacterium]
MFLAWCFRHGFSGDLHLESEPDAVKAVIDGRMTGREFLATYCDGTFNEEDLNADGKAFADDYYESEEYLEDFEKTFVRKRTPTIYDVPDDAGSYERIAKVIDKRFRQWRQALARRKQGEIDLAASGSAAGVLDLRTGELIFSDPDFRLGPGTTRADFLQSPAGQVADVHVDNPPHTSWRIRATPTMGGARMDVVVFFKGDKAFMLSLGIHDSDPPKNPWDPQYRAERCRIDSDWVDRVFGSAREFSWGSMQVAFDSRSGSSGIYFRYQ